MTSRVELALGPGGKDVVVIASRAELSEPGRATLPEPEPAPGLILEDGSINWGCPCLGGMATGPCGPQFRDAFSCFHYSEAEPKGSDCYEKFSVMQDCMAKYPELYGKDDDDEEGLAGTGDSDDAPVAAAAAPAASAPAASAAAAQERDAPVK
ncbi:mitochondrial intermembrane space import and assembly protein 40 isoform X2 [Battus philenor]